MTVSLTIEVEVQESPVVRALGHGHLGGQGVGECHDPWETALGKWEKSLWVAWNGEQLHQLLVAQKIQPRKLGPWIVDQRRQVLENLLLWRATSAAMIGAELIYNWCIQWVTVCWRHNENYAQELLVMVTYNELYCYTQNSNKTDPRLQVTLCALCCDLWPVWRWGWWVDFASCLPVGCDTLSRCGGETRWPSHPAHQRSPASVPVTEQVFRQCVNTLCTSITV